MGKKNVFPVFKAVKWFLHIYNVSTFAHASQPVHMTTHTYTLTHSQHISAVNILTAKAST